MKRAISLMLLVTVNIVSPSQNLIMNPGFEIWTKINKPAGWATAENCLKDSVSIISGMYSLRHEGGTSSKDLGQTISITPGKSFLLSLYYKTEISNNGNGCRIWCYWKDNDGKSISDPATNSILRPSGYMKSDIWEQYNASFTAPVQAVALYFEVRVYPNSVVYWDDFVLEEDITTYRSEKNITDISIYPDPAHNYLIIRNIQNLHYINIQSITGTTVWSGRFAGEQNVEVPVANLSDGIYIIHIRTSDKLVSGKFVKN
jgi:hypothetical protein